MTRIHGLAALSLIVAASVALADDPQPAKKKPVPKVGQIFNIGNENVPDYMIRRVMQISPGQTLDYADLPRIQADLIKSKLFEKDGTSVRVANPGGDDEYKDIVVTVKESRWGVAVGKVDRVVGEVEGFAIDSAVRVIRVFRSDLVPMPSTN